MWQPLLHGSLATRAGALLESLVTSLAEAEDQPPAPRAGLVSGHDDPSLTGLGGRALLWAALADARPDGGFAARGERCLDRARDLLAEHDLMPALFGGFTGLAFVIDQIFGSDGDQDANEEIDGLLLALLERDHWPFHYDLISGLAGIGVYLLGRLQRPAARAGLAAVVRHLEALAVPRGPGVAWFTDAETLPPSTRHLTPSGYYNCGAAHGAPAAALVLAAACRAGVEAARARPLLDGAVRWLWQPRFSDDALSALPYYEQAEQPPQTTRLAWCYGDVGAALPMLLAARAGGDAAAEAQALAVARRSLRRTLADSGVADAGLCHGSAGLGLLYARLHQLTGEAPFAEAARRWFGVTVEQAAAGGRFGGLVFALPEQSTGDDDSFLTGAGGVALALLAALGDAEPRWDACLGASLPPELR